MLYGDDRNALRRQFFEVWRKLQDEQALAPLEAMIAAVIREHPEYQALLGDPARALERDYPVEAGKTNPFLHMGMHIALQEQLTTDRPAGILDIYRRLCRRCGDSHTAEHRMMECLGETLWEAQRSGAVPDEAAYLRRLRRLAQGGERPAR